MKMEEADKARAATIAFRTTADVKALVQAAAARRDVLPSDVLRSWVRGKVVEEFGPEALPDHGPAEGDDDER